MRDPISNDFALANGIAAFALVQEVLMYLESAGMPRETTIRITETAQQVVQMWCQASRHKAVPLAASLLAAVAQRLQAPPDSKH